MSSTPQRKILFADDDEHFREEWCGFLRRRGYCVVEARHGEEALDLIMKNPGEFGLLILDVYMPANNRAQKTTQVGINIADELERRARTRGPWSLSMMR